VSEARDYYNSHFGPHLIEVANANLGRRDNISLMWLIPGAVNVSPGQALTFSLLEETHRVLFLMCYFYSALLDQAIHAGLRQEHPAFDNLARYPKLVGILGGAYTNLHPANLLVAATMHMKTLSSETVTALFDDLTTFMIDEYIRFFTVEYPALTTRLQSRDAQLQAIRVVLHEAVQATTPPEPNLWRHAFTRGNTPANWQLADAMIRQCNRQLRATLARIAAVTLPTS
jgi:hypothetical protein